MVFKRNTHYQVMYVAMDIVGFSRNIDNQLDLLCDRNNLFQAIERTSLFANAAHTDKVRVQFVGDELRIAFESSAASPSATTDFAVEVNQYLDGLLADRRTVARTVVLEGSLQCREDFACRYLHGLLPHQAQTMLDRVPAGHVASLWKMAHSSNSIADFPKLWVRKVSNATESSAPKAVSFAPQGDSHFIVALGAHVEGATDLTAKPKALEQLIALVSEARSLSQLLPEEVLTSIASTSLILAIKSSTFDSTQNFLESLRAVTSSRPTRISAAVGVGRLLPIKTHWLSDNFEGGEAIFVARVLAKLEAGSLGISEEVSNFWNSFPGQHLSVLSGKRNETFKAIIDPHWFDHSRTVAEDIRLQADISTTAVARVIESQTFAKAVGPGNTALTLLAEGLTPEVPKTSLSSDQLVSHLCSLDLDVRETVLNDMSCLLSTLCGEVRTSTFVEKLLEKIISSTGHEYKITGSTGSGKSTLLACLYALHDLKYAGREEQLVPLYFNIENYAAGDVELSADIEQAKKQIANGAIAVAYIDGCDEYFRDPRIDTCYRTLTQHLKKLKVRRSIIACSTADPSSGLAYVRSETAPKAVSLAHVDAVLWDGTDCQLLTDFCKVSRAFGHTIELTLLKKNLEILEPQKLDIFLLKMASSGKLSGSFATQASLSSVYGDYIRLAIEERAEVEGYEVKAALERLADRVFLEQVPPVQHKISQPVGSEGEVKLDEFLTSLLLFSQSHSSIRHFLIAEHIVRNCLDIPEVLGYRIYGHGINRFVKSLINRDIHLRSKILAGITKRLEANQDGILAQAHLVYILGRLELVREEEKEVKKLLSAHLQRRDKEYSDRNPSMSVGTKKQKISTDSTNNHMWDLLYLRTLYISLIYLGESNLARHYVERLLERDDWDLLNRGFHLQYYGDLAATLSGYNMVASDIDLRVRPVIIYRVLSRRLSGYLNVGKCGPAALVELHTLLSLFVNRHVEGLVEDSIRVAIHHLVDSLIKTFRNLVPPFYEGYIHYALELLKMPTMSAYEVSGKVLGLKEQLRSGWIFSGTRQGERVNRNVSRQMVFRDETSRKFRDNCQPESVSDHSWGCAMMAWMLLPESDEYSKDKVIKMLLIHDLAEVESGDIVSETGAGENEEFLQEKVAAVGYLDRFRGASSWRKMLSDYRQTSTREAEIAHDIDKIERYVQAVRYYSEPSNEISDIENWEPKLKSREGIEMLATLRIPPLKDIK